MIVSSTPTTPASFTPEVLVLPPTGHEHPPPPDAEDPAQKDEPPDEAQSEAEAGPEAETEVPPPPATTAPPTTSTTAPETTTTVAPAATAPTTSVINVEPPEQAVDAASQDDGEAKGSGLGWWLAFGGLSSAALVVGAKRHIERRC